MRGRPLLGAHVAGPAAVWVLRRVEGELPDSVRHYRSVGREDLARALERAVGELRAAADLWQAANAEAVSGFGSGEVSCPEVGAVLVVPEVSSSPLAVDSAAAVLGVSGRRVRQLLTAGLLEGEKVGSRWLVDRGSVERYRTDRRLIA